MWAPYRPFPEEAATLKNLIRVDVTKKFMINV